MLSSGELIEFAETHLRIRKDEPLILMDWQKEFMHNLFNPDVRVFYCQISKKNGKSETIALCIIMILMFFPDAHVVSAAVKKEQAADTWRTCKRIIQFSGLEHHFTFNLANKRIISNESGFYYEAVSSNSDGVEGILSKYQFIDEFHVAGKKSDSLLQALRYASANFDDGCICLTTTAGVYNPENICYKHYERAKLQQKAKVKDSTFASMIFELDEDDSPHDESSWIKCNPSLASGVLSLDMFRKDHEEAKAAGGNTWNQFLRYRLGTWVISIDAWIDDSLWSGLEHCTEQDLLECETVYCGVDLAISKDICSFVVVGFDGEKYLVMPYLYLPEESIPLLQEKTGYDYQRWVDRGELRTVQGSVITSSFIMQTLDELISKYNISKMNCDSAFMANIEGDINKEFSKVECYSFRQHTSTYNQPTRETEKLIQQGRIKHNHSDLMAWMFASSRTLEDRFEQIRIVKLDKSRKVDGVQSLIMCMALHINDMIEGELREKNKKQKVERKEWAF